LSLRAQLIGIAALISRPRNAATYLGAIVGAFSIKVNPNDAQAAL
jgi:hypothetical protein